ncbi:hypothetical protein N656DRAFT_776268 [Canariomyces notabilis]|uniref:Amidohydrolase-related domain-containing protein n=1 Tax=Canariomyces notabilis TaxID=2074819 RepID=A0AAN6TIW2_9PEZI|nr:hypothetical protein N656DRAFT_776268 [Canariomyces arenarius]
MATPKPQTPVVDIHTHMYPPEYISMLSSRASIPLVRTFPSSPDPRLVLLEAEVPALEKATGSGDANAPGTILPGRPLTRHFTSLSQKISFMDTHNISISVLSLANPWLDFLPANEAVSIARSINASFEEMCGAHPGRLYFFASLPLTSPLEAILSFITTALPSFRHCRGIILGTSGLGSGLDDPAMLPMFAALADANLPVFLHPHYGLPNSVFGKADYGHVLPLALGFPMETTIAVARMYLAGVFDAVPGLRMILAHSGGTLPFLAGRIESCLLHDAKFAGAVREQGDRRRTVWDVLREQVYLDAVVYSEVGLKAAIEASGGGKEGAARLMFGTDHPFFPPLGGPKGAEDGEWESVRLNADAVGRALGEGSEEAEMVMGGNAVRVLRLYEE